MPERHSLAVARTDVKGMEFMTFEGGSPKVRQDAGLADLDTLYPNRLIQAPNSHVRFTRHAEEDVINQFIRQVDKLGLDHELVTGTFKLHQSNPAGVCRICIQGLNNPNVAPGILKRFSEEFPNLRIEVTSEKNLVVKPNGRLDFAIQNGEYIK